MRLLLSSLLPGLLCGLISFPPAGPPQDQAPVRAQEEEDDKVQEIDFSVLSDFEYEEGMELPDAVKKLGGKKIRIVGFPRSADGEVEDLTYFWLVDQNCECEGNPAMNEMMFVILPEDLTHTLDDEPLKVEGILSVGEQKEDGYVLSLYRFAATKLSK